MSWAACPRCGEAFTADRYFDAHRVFVCGHDRHHQDGFGMLGGVSPSGRWSSAVSVEGGAAAGPGARSRRLVVSVRP
jgi:hypothetical protein